MNRRAVLKRIGATGIAALALTLPRTAIAGKGWCRSEPWGLFDDQLVEFYGNVFTESDGSTIVSRSMDIYVPSGHLFSLVEPYPPYEVRVHGPATAGDPRRWVIAFQFTTSNGDSRGQIETIPHADGDITPLTREFANYAGAVSFKAQ
jgi:hypothetical protein